MSRIAVIAEYFPPRLGADRRIFELTRRLAKKHDIHFVTLPPSYTLFIRKIETHDKNDQDISCDGMRCHRLVLPKFFQTFWKKNLLLAFFITEVYLLFQMLKKIAQLKPDIIIVNDTSIYTGLLGFISSKLLNKKLLVDYNDLMGLYTLELIGKRFNHKSQKLLSYILTLVEDSLVRHSWRVTAITYFIKNYANSRNVKREIIIIPNGVDTHLFDPNRADGKQIRFAHNIKDGTKLCVYTGRIEEVAGAAIIFEIVKLLKNEEKIKFMLVGEGDPAFLTEFSKYNNVILTGLVSKETIPDYLSAADVVFVPFSDTVACHGISPLKLFEALAMGKPIIASMICGIKEAVSECPHVTLVSNNPQSWVSAIDAVLNNGKMDANQTIPNNEVANSYDFNHLAQIFDNVIEERI